MGAQIALTFTVTQDREHIHTKRVGGAPNPAIVVNPDGA
jgi:hypothetical protein